MRNQFLADYLIILLNFFAPLKGGSEPFIDNLKSISPSALFAQLSSHSLTPFIHLLFIAHPQLFILLWYSSNLFMHFLTKSFNTPQSRKTHLILPLMMYYPFECLCWRYYSTARFSFEWKCTYWFTCRLLIRSI